MPLAISDEQKKKYNDFVRSSPYGKCSQDLEWARVKSGWDCDAVYIEDEGRISAAMTILSVNSVSGKKLLYANRAPVCDFYDVDLVKKLLDEAGSVIEKYDAFLLRLDPEIPYDKQLIERYRKLGFVFREREADIHSFIQPRYDMLLKLEGRTEEEVFKSFHKKTGYNIRLAERKGVSTSYVSQSDGEKALSNAIDIFFELTEIMARRQGITHRPKSYFQRLFEAFENSRVYLSEYNGEVLSAALAVPYGSKLFYMYGASGNNERNRMPNFQMQWEMIKWAISSGMKEYDFGGVFKLDDSDGLYRFKRGFCKEHTEWIGELDLVFDDEAYKEFLKK